MSLCMVVADAKWTCPALVESVRLTFRAFRSKALGLWKPSHECRLTGSWNPSMHLEAAVSA
ncbi:MAG: hypothetical protein J0L76_00800 [Rhodobacterales bacterium]|nr:hypothetical protein [Rhodobacterales bacterium]